MDIIHETIDPTDAILSERTAAAPPAARKPRKWLRRLAGAVALLALLPAGGATYEAAASLADATTYPAPGRLVDIGGHKLHLYCEGTGRPAIVLDAGLAKSSLDWSLVQPRLAASTTVCSYDRAGMGWSEPGPLPRTPQRNADELYRLLTAGGVEGPYILVGHSLAGKNARLFAAAHPADVAGMVLVDARSERLDIGAGADEVAGFKSALEQQAMLYTAARRLGVVRLWGASLAGAPLLPSDTAREIALFDTLPNAVAAGLAEGEERAHDDAVLAASTLGDLPLVVVAAGDNMRKNPAWPAAQNALAALSTRGRLVVAGHSSHAVHIDQPNVVIDAVLSVLADARRHDEPARPSR